MARDMRNDGWINRVELYLTTHFALFWNLIQLIPPLRRQINRILINRAILRMPTRPNPLSTMSSYTSWSSLTDRTFDSRHLPPALPELPDRKPPDLERTADLFARQGDTILCPKSTVLFAYFAQWFSDGFLRSDRGVPVDPRKNTSNHDFDLSQLYGLNSKVTQLLRTHKGGTLKSQVIDGEELPLNLCENGVIKPEFQGLPVVRFDELSTAQKNGLFAMGGDRANSQIGNTMFNVLFLREHNRTTRLLAEEYPRWDDERLFQTARIILILEVINVVVSEYLNHITPYHFKFFVDASAFPNARWHRPNWMAVEFNLLYRWHGLVPSTLRIGGEDLPLRTTIYNNEMLTKRGMALMFEDASHQRAGRIGLFNTDPALREIEVQSILRGRQVQLATYNDYRALCRFPRVTEFDQISGDPEVQQALQQLYRNVENIELYVGLFAEDLRPNSVLPSLMGRMVAVDAFSQALTTPLLAPRIFNERTFSPLGMSLIQNTKTLSDLVHRNVSNGDSQRYFISMTRQNWQRGSSDPIPILSGFRNRDPISTSSYPR
ncbi:MAG: peroxidase family protein [Pseudonocardiaceae bacterium]